LVAVAIPGGDIMTSRKTLFAALAAFALLASPALAGNGHGNGGGNGGGNGNGNGGGNGNAGGKSGNSGSHGKSASAKGQVAKAETEAVASVDDTEETASVSKEKNIHAKLGRLNSLQRNINAYMNSKSKKFAGVQAFVTQSAIAKNAQAAADAAAAAAAAAVTEANAAIADLTTKLADANALTPATPDEQTAKDALVKDLTDQITAQQKAITDAQTAAQTAQDAATAAAAAVPSLDTALADMANKPVDTEVKDWANGVLADKIDQMAAKLAPATP
jgi:chromosome segregation ATPase